MRMTFSKDKECKHVLATGHCKPFKSMTFDLQHDTKVGFKNRVIHLEDMAVTFTYSKFKGKDFLMTVKAAAHRDDRRVQVTFSDDFMQIEKMIFVPPDPQTLIKDGLLTNPLPISFLKLLGRELSHLDMGPLRTDFREDAAPSGGNSNFSRTDSGVSS